MSMIQRCSIHLWVDCYGSLILQFVFSLLLPLQVQLGDVERAWSGRASFMSIVDTSPFFTRSRRGCMISKMWLLGFFEFQFLPRRRGKTWQRFSYQVKRIHRSNRLIKLISFATPLNPFVSSVQHSLSVLEEHSLLTSTPPIFSFFSSKVTVHFALVAILGVMTRRREYTFQFMNAWCVFFYVHYDACLTLHANEEEFQNLDVRFLVNFIYVESWLYIFNLQSVYSTLSN